MDLFFTSNIHDKEAFLTGDEARHCTRVMRHQPGDHIMVTNGQGMAWQALITGTDQSEVRLELLEAFPEYGEPGIPVSLVFSPLRLKDRMEWMLEKGVELGVSEFIPVRCQRTDKYKAKLKRERLETILLTAAKQCLRSRFPVLREETSWDSFIKESAQSTQLSVIARADAELPLGSLLDARDSKAGFRLAIGPEGDFTDEELSTAWEAGWQPVQLGKQRLRSETAALFALSAVKLNAGF